MRARRVVFAARFKAGERGAGDIGIDDFLLGLILEDQNMIGTLVKDAFPGIRQAATPVGEMGEAHSQFFAADTAHELLTRIGNLLPRSTHVSLSTEIPLSSDLKRVFDEAEGVRKTFRHKRIGPLHLLLVMLREKTNDGVELLEKAGITEEQVLQALSAASVDS